MNRYQFTAATALLATLVLTGCNSSKTKPQPDAATGPSTPDPVAAERTKLDPADRTLVEAQDWCVVNTEERLGSMGLPMKLDIKGQPVFICCKGCKRKAEADPEKTLAMVAELKARAKVDQKK